MKKKNSIKFSILFILKFLYTRLIYIYINNEGGGGVMFERRKEKQFYYLEILMKESSHLGS